MQLTQHDNHLYPSLSIYSTVYTTCGGGCVLCFLLCSTNRYWLVCLPKIQKMHFYSLFSPLLKFSRKIKEGEVNCSGFIYETDREIKDDLIKSIRKSIHDISSDPLFVFQGSFFRCAFSLATPMSHWKLNETKPLLAFIYPPSTLL